MSDALAFANRARAERVLLLHHDPLHSDEFLDTLGDAVAERISQLGKSADWMELAKERWETTLQGVERPTAAPVD